MSAATGASPRRVARHSDPGSLPPDLLRERNATGPYGTTGCTGRGQRSLPRPPRPLSPPSPQEAIEEGAQQPSIVSPGPTHDGRLVTAPPAGGKACCSDPGGGGQVDSSTVSFDESASARDAALCARARSGGTYVSDASRRAPFLVASPERTLEGGEVPKTQPPRRREAHSSTGRGA